MDCRSETLQQRAWDANAAAMAPALASDYVARNVDGWLHRLTDYVARETRSKEATDCLEIISKEMAYLADVAVETSEPRLSHRPFSVRQEGPSRSSHGRGTTCPDHILEGCPFEGSLLLVSA